MWLLGRARLGPLPQCLRNDSLLRQAPPNSHGRTKNTISALVAQPEASSLLHGTYRWARSLAPLFVRAGGKQQVCDTSYRPTMTPLRVSWPEAKRVPRCPTTVLDFAPHLGVKIAWLGWFARFCPPQRPILPPTGHPEGVKMGHHYFLKTSAPCLVRH